MTQRSFIDSDGDYHAPGLSHEEIWDIIEAHRSRTHSNAGPVPESKKYRIEITQRAYEVLKIMVEDNNPEVFPFNSESLSEWIMEEWGGYCDAYGEPDVEIG